MKSIVLFSLFFCLAFNASSQGRVIADGRILGLVGGKSGGSYMGFRLHISFDAEKSVVESDRKKFISQFPGVDTYFAYRTPYFYLDAGDFRTKAEADELHKKLIRQYPLSTVVRQAINLPRID
ncbi:MAG: hypothetical protein FJX84_04275 [Bacteroidetes bacterium]|nr:hypothetical protein [Bacteroidota bacterium]